KSPRKRNPPGGCDVPVVRDYATAVVRKSKKAWLWRGICHQMYLASRDSLQRVVAIHGRTVSIPDRKGKLLCCGVSR
ncbi:MAG TPA: hypothetical protein PLJ47_16455, partial [Candidatus Hydrogenedentes bacterium]|nr:hypothetical protein [Candidatus Hydrogenedentota bacterium]